MHLKTIITCVLSVCAHLDKYRSMRTCMLIYVHTNIQTFSKQGLGVPDLSPKWIFRMREASSQWNHWLNLACNLTSKQSCHDVQHELRSYRIPREHRQKRPPTPQRARWFSKSNKSCLSFQSRGAPGLNFLWVRFLCSLSLEKLHSSLGAWWKFPDFDAGEESHFWLGNC